MPLWQLIQGRAVQEWQEIGDLSTRCIQAQVEGRRQLVAGVCFHASTRLSVEPRDRHTELQQQLSANGVTMLEFESVATRVFQTAHAQGTQDPNEHEQQREAGDQWQ
jgi:hypothetical protein